MTSKNSKPHWHSNAPSHINILFVIIAGIIITAVLYFIQTHNILTPQDFTSENLTALRFSEIQADNDSAIFDSQGNASDWIEIENAGNTAVNLDGISIIKDTNVNSIFTFPNISLEAGERAVICCSNSDNTDDMTAHFTLSAAGGNTLNMFDQANQLIDSVTIPEIEKGYTLCRDQTGEWVKTVIATPGAANQVSLTAENKNESVVTDTILISGDIEISEVMTGNNYYCPASDGNFYDYIELHNIGTQKINLSDMYLSDNAEALKKWALPDYTIDPDEYVIIFCSGSDGENNTREIHAPFKLSSDGETVSLADANASVICSVEIPSMGYGEALSRVNGVMTTELAPTPGMANTMENASEINAELHNAGNFPVCINEIMASPEEQEFDWIELYNSGDSTIDLSQYYLSDNLKTPRKWQFSNGTSIGPGEYKIVYLTGSEEADVAGNVCAPFALSADGGYTVCISDAQGKILDAIRLGQQYSGISYGRTTGMTLGYFENITLGSENPSTCLLGKADEVQFSEVGGLYNTGDSLTVTLSCLSGRIYYTTDCSDPTQSSTLYTGTPITVNSTAIIRARVYRDGYMPSSIGTQSYLFDINNVDNVSYIVSLVSDPEGLYSDSTGILVKGPNAEEKFPYGDYGEGANFWMDWERESHIELFTASGTAVSQECGIKVRGRNSRGYELKSLKVKASNKYGSDRFYYPVFSNRDYTDYDQLILRYSGQDYKYAFMRDVVIMSFAKYTSVMYMESELAIVYLNGEYYSAMYIREPIDALQICRYNNWPESDMDSLDIVKSGYTISQGSNETFLELKEWLSSHDTSTDEAYDYIDERVDIDNYIDYVCMVCLAGTEDTVNVKRYRNPNTDGKWRWAIYDADRGLRENDVDPFALLAQGTTAQLFQACINNVRIREKIFERINELLATAFTCKNLSEAIDAKAVEVQPVMTDYLNMWGISLNKWKNYVKDFKETAIKRPAQIIQHAVEDFNLTDEQKQTYFADAISSINEYIAGNS